MEIFSTPTKECNLLSFRQTPPKFLQYVTCDAGEQDGVWAIDKF